LAAAGVKVYIVEDHPVMREVLTTFLEGEAGIDVCGAASTAEAALADLADARPDLLLIDVSLPGMSGLDLVRRLAGAEVPGLGCLVLSGHREEIYVDVALQAGARGYLVKGNPLELRLALREVSAGGSYVSPSLQHPDSA
jgi:DNA-binding NarL/FixJ family response regulator